MTQIDFDKFTLLNGLQVILHQDMSLPVTAVNLWYHVGSKNEEPGRTGFAHLFEHVMFEGSKNHNHDFFEPLWKVGGNLNGSTDPDRTNYWENIPSDALELALWLESDRMGFLLETLDEERFRVQRDVVKNERRQSYENRPYGMAIAHIQEALFPLPHPYNWLTIGSQEDLDAASIEDIEAFFKRYYSPSNCSLSIAGNFDRNNVEALVRKYFEDIPPGEPLPRMHRQDSSLSSQIILSINDKVSLPRLYFAWPTVPWRDSDTPALSLLASIIGDGKSSRLYQSLVYEKQIAQDVNAFFMPSEIAGEFYITVTAAPGNEPNALREAVLEEIRTVQTTLVTNDELEKAKNRFESRFVRRLQRIGGFGGRADQLNRYNVLAGNPDLLNSETTRYLEVSANQIQDVANSVLGDNRVELTVNPQAELSAAVSNLDRSIMPKPQGQPRFVPPSAVETTLENGMKTIVIEKNELPVITFGLLLKNGAISDPELQPGLSYMTASMLTEGTETRSSQQIAEEFESLGTQIFTGTRREITTVNSESLTKHWSDALNLTADIVLHPTFASKELTRVLREHLTDIERIQDDPTSLADRVTPMALYGANTPYGHPVSGTKIGLENLQQADLTEQYESIYSPDAATLVVVGDVKSSDVNTQIENLFGKWRSKNSNSKTAKEIPPIVNHSQPEQSILLLDKPGAPQSVLRIGHQSIPRSHPDYFTMSLIVYSLGGHFSSRLNKNLREDKGYTYGYRSWIEWQNPASLFISGGGVQTPNTGDAIRETILELNNIANDHPVTAEELKDAKEGIIRSLPESFATTDQILGQLGELVHFDLPLSYFSEYGDQIENVTLEDTTRVAKEQIKLEQLTIIVVGDLRTIEPQIKDLSVPIKYIDNEGNVTDS